MTSPRSGYAVLADVTNYLNLAPAQGCTVACVIEEFEDGTCLVIVAPSTLVALGCDVGTCNLPFPFYDNEVILIKE